MGRKTDKALIVTTVKSMERVEREALVQTRWKELHNEKNYEESFLYSFRG
jgi:hypothetical protein